MHSGHNCEVIWHAKNWTEASYPSEAKGEMVNGRFSLFCFVFFWHNNASIDMAASKGVTMLQQQNWELLERQDPVAPSFHLLEFWNTTPRDRRLADDDGKKEAVHNYININQKIFYF